MSIQQITDIVIISTALILIAWDIYAVWKAGGKGTISYVIANAGKKNRMVPVAWGVLTGHFFWQIESLCQSIIK